MSCKEKNALILIPLLINLKCFYAFTSSVNTMQTVNQKELAIVVQKFNSKIEA